MGDNAMDLHVSVITVKWYVLVVFWIRNNAKVVDYETDLIGEVLKAYS